jgi:hypothetical protein
MFRDMECVLAQVGGNWNNGSHAGLSNWNLNNTSSNANLNIGALTLIRKQIQTLQALYIPHHLVKIRPKEQGLVGWFSKHLEANKKVER